MTQAEREESLRMPLEIILNEIQLVQLLTEISNRNLYIREIRL